MLEFFQNLFSPITSILGGVLTFFYGYGVPWWLSIVFLTIIVRAVLFPLTAKQIRSMRAMQELKPEIDPIRDEHREDPQRMQQEMMRLYRELNVNPLGSGLPVLLQVPVFIGIFYVILEFGGSAGMIGGTDQPETHPTFTQGGALWFTDLTARDPYFILTRTLLRDHAAFDGDNDEERRAQAAMAHARPALRLPGYNVDFPCRAVRLLDRQQPHHDGPELRDVYLRQLWVWQEYLYHRSRRISFSRVAVRGNACAYV